MFLSRDLLGAGPRRQAPAISVRSTGAKGDGRTNDTAAIQRAIDGLPERGGRVAIPAGRYLVNAERGIRLRSGLRLECGPGAILTALPTAAASSALLVGTDVADVQILGGTFNGSRGQHRGASGEWGMGIALRGCRDVEILDVTVEECWGDGIYLGHSITAGAPGGECEHITLRRSACRRNRRQGMSVTACRDLLVEDCEFSGTGGTSPSAGVDLEPNAGKVVEGVLVLATRFEGNAGWGFLSGGVGVRGLHLARCRFAGNGLGGVRLARTFDSRIEYNDIDVGVNGVAVRLDGGSSRNAITRNRLTENGHPMGSGRGIVERDGASGNTLQ